MKGKDGRRIYIEVILLFAVAVYLWYRLAGMTGMI